MPLLHVADFLDAPKKPGPALSDVLGAIRGGLSVCGVVVTTMPARTVEIGGTCGRKRLVNVVVDAAVGRT